MKKISILLTSAAALTLAACDAGTDDTAVAPVTTDAMGADQMANTNMATDNIVQVAQGNPDFSTLVTAVQSANLGTTLSGPGPYTVFAPTNAAFEKIPQATRDELLSPAGQEQLSSILNYHVVQGAVTAAQLTQAIEAAGAGGYTINTVNGEELTATLDNGQVILTDATGSRATVTQTDVDASNGVIHAIDTVLMPN